MQALGLMHTNGSTAGESYIIEVRRKIDIVIIFTAHDFSCISIALKQFWNHMFSSWNVITDMIPLYYGKPTISPRNDRLSNRYTESQFARRGGSNGRYRTILRANLRSIRAAGDASNFPGLCQNHAI